MEKRESAQENFTPSIGANSRMTSPIAWDVDFGPPPALAVSLRLPRAALEELAAAAAQGKGGADAGPTLAVDLPAQQAVGTAVSEI